MKSRYYGAFHDCVILNKEHNAFYSPTKIVITIVMCQELVVFMIVSYYWCRTEQLLSVQGASPERLGTNGHELALFGQAMDTSQNPHLSGVSNNLVSF